MKSPIRKSRLATCTSAALAVAAGALALSSSAGAATFNATDATSFATAVASVNSAAPNSGPNTIVVASGTYSPSATTDFTNTTDPVTIQGPTPQPTVKQTPASISGLAITSPVTGAPVFKIEAGVSVSFVDVEVTGGGVAGVNPAIDDFGTATVTQSDIAGNGGTGVFVEPGATGSIANATLSDNGDYGLIDQGTATLSNTTVTTNSNGGVANTGATLHLINTIVAENGPANVTNCTHVATSNDHTIDNSSPSTCGIAAGPLNANPQLAAINPFGGPTSVHAPTSTSNAIDAGNPATCLTVDERGAARPDDVGTACDIGAVERSSSLTFTNTNVNVGVVSPATSKSVTFGALAPGAGAPVKSTCSPASPQTVTVGTPLSVTCNGTDAFGNAASTSFTITALTASNPTVSVPAAQTATSPDGSPVVVSYPAATATDTVDGTDPVTCIPASGTSFAVGTTTVNCSATNSAGLTGSNSFTVTVAFAGDVASNTGNVKGEVGSQLSITAFTADFGPFTPGAVNLGSLTTATYNATAAVTVTSTDASTILTINDTSTAPTTGHLVNGTYSLKNPVQDEATSLSPFATSVPTPVAFQNLTGSPKQILSYSNPVTGDPVTLGFQQVIGNTEGLHRGTYAATVLLQLTGTP